MDFTPIDSLPFRSLSLFHLLSAYKINTTRISIGNFQLVARFTSTTVINAGKTVEMPQTQYYQTETGFVYPGSKLSNFTSLQGQEIGLMLPNVDSSIHFSKGSCSSGNGSNMIVYENGTGIFNEGINKEDESQASYAVPPLQEVDQDELFDSIPTDQVS